MAGRNEGGKGERKKDSNVEGRKKEMKNDSTVEGRKKGQ